MLENVGVRLSSWVELFFARLTPMTPVPVVTSCAMIPGATNPNAAGSAPPPVAGMVVISSPTPYPVAIDPDIVRSGSPGAGINDIGRLGCHIPIHCAASDSHEAAGNGYDQK